MAKFVTKDGVQTMTGKGQWVGFAYYEDGHEGEQPLVAHAKSKEQAMAKLERKITRHVNANGGEFDKWLDYYVEVRS